MKNKIRFALVLFLFSLYGVGAFAKTINLDIKGMTCSMCAAKVEGSIKKVEGVSSCSFDHTTGKGTVDFDESKTSVDKVLDACNRTGFKCQL